MGLLCYILKLSGRESTFVLLSCKMPLIEFRVKGSIPPWSGANPTLQSFPFSVWFVPCWCSTHHSFYRLDFQSTVLTKLGAEILFTQKSNDNKYSQSKHTAMNQLKRLSSCLIWLDATDLMWADVLVCFSLLTSPEEMSCITQRQVLKSFSLSYQKKAWLTPWQVQKKNDG